MFSEEIVARLKNLCISKGVNQNDDTVLSRDEIPNDIDLQIERVVLYPGGSIIKIKYETLEDQDYLLTILFASMRRIFGWGKFKGIEIKNLKTCKVFLTKTVNMVVIEYNTGKTDRADFEYSDKLPKDFEGAIYNIIERKFEMITYVTVLHI